MCSSDLGVVGAEADLTFLRGVGDDALLGAAEVGVEEILEPHAGDEQEIPAIGAADVNVGLGAVAFDGAVVLAGGAEGLIHLLDHVSDLEVGGCLEGIVVADQRQDEADRGEELAAGCVVDLGEVLGYLTDFEEGRNWRCFLGLLVDH